jgi:hypothetical protein
MPLLSHACDIRNVTIRKSAAMPKACRVFDTLACCCEPKKAHKCSCLVQLSKLEMISHYNASKDRHLNIREPTEAGDVILAA